MTVTDVDKAYRILDESQYSFQMEELKEKGIPHKTMWKMEQKYNLIVMNNRKMADTFCISKKYLKGNANTKNYGTRIEQFENTVKVRFPAHGKRNRDTLLELKSRGLL